MVMKRVGALAFREYSRRRCGSLVVVFFVGLLLIRSLYLLEAVISTRGCLLELYIAKAVGIVKGWE